VVDDPKKYPGAYAPAAARWPAASGGLSSSMLWAGILKSQRRHLQAALLGT